MRSNKRYSNVAITKRVDYDGGAHRPAKAPKEPRVCERCGNVYVKRRWVLPTDPRAPIVSAVAERVTCPACKAQASGVPRGHLTLTGDFLAAHRAEIETLLKREAERAAEDNPLGRILTMDTTTADQLSLTTSTEHLVERLGHAVTSAFGGTMDFGFSHGNKFARATWRRD
jgi:hypothetical protein